MSRSVWMQDLTSEEVQDYLTRRNEVIVPIGSTEIHGPHLPLGVDAFEAIDYAEGIARRGDVLVTPPIWFGDNYWLMHGTGTISLRPETVISLLKDIYSSLLEHGFRKILTFNGHRLANLPAIGIASRTVKNAHPDAVFVSIDPLNMTETHVALRESFGSGQHGDEFETSHMLFKRPELVKPEKFMFSHGCYPKSRFLSVDVLAGGDRFQFYRGKGDEARLAPLGHVGDPEKASREKGEKLFEAVVSAGVEFIEDLRRWADEGYEIRSAVGAEGRDLLEHEQEWRARTAPDRLNAPPESA